MGNVVIVNGIGGTTGTITGGTTKSMNTNGGPITGGTTVVFNGQQVAGLVKMIPCGFTDCRESDQIWCYHLPVFGQNGFGNPPGYQNDNNMFMVNFSGQGNPSFVLQKASSSFFTGKEQPWVWNNVTTSLQNNCGTAYPLGTIAGHPSYIGFQYNWGNIVTHADGGPGYYRILFQSCVTTTTGGGMGKAQATSFWNQQTFPSPAAYRNANPWSGSVKFTSVAFSIQCGNTLYTVPLFWVNSASGATSLAAIINTLNAWFNAMPGGPLFAAVVNAVTPNYNFDIVGTQYAAQNGCIVNCNYSYFSGTSTNMVQLGFDDIGPVTMQGGNNGSTGTKTTTCTCGLQSPVFELLAWDCNRANGTTKFEVWNSGTRGDANIPGFLTDLCGLSLYDSIRVTGYFRPNGFTYDPLILENALNGNVPFGTLEQVRDKGTPLYKWFGILLPDWVHKGLASVMMMADTTFVSDYNIANPDWTIMRKNVKKKVGANYIPDYIDGKQFSLYEMDYGRRDDVTVEFQEGVQSLIASSCCLLATSAAG